MILAIEIMRSIYLDTQLWKQKSKRKAESQSGLEKGATYSVVTD